MHDRSSPQSERDAAWSLLIACARHAAGLSDVAEVRNVGRAVSDWPAAVRLAEEQGLLLLLARDLLESGNDAHRERLEVRARECAERALDRLRVLRGLASGLADAGVRAVSYKGPVLSLQLYGDHALRTSADLDIVVARSAYERARHVLVSAGFTPRNDHSLRRERALFGWLGHAPFRGAGTDVELHWRFSPIQCPVALDPDVAYARGMDVQLGGVSVRGLGELDNVVVLCSHATRHLYERLEWLAGVTVMLRRLEGSVDSLLSHASALGAGRVVLITARVANLLLNMPLNDAWHRALRADPESESLANEIANATVAHGRADAPFVDGAALQRLYSRFRVSRLDRAFILARAALSPTERDWQTVPLPDVLVPLYRVIRPARLAIVYGARLLGRRDATRVGQP